MVYKNKLFIGENSRFRTDVPYSQKKRGSRNLLPLKILLIHNRSNEPGGAPRSESEIQMIAGGNHTLIYEPIGVTITTGLSVSYSFCCVTERVWEVTTSSAPSTHCQRPLAA